MAAYLDRFEELLNEVSGQSEASLINFFIGGLKPELRCELNIIKPASLQKAFSMAKIYESQKGSTKHGGSVPNSVSLLKTPPTRAKGVPIVRKILTAEGRKERTTKGLCFNYDDPFSPGHKCRGWMFCLDASQQRLVEVMDRWEDDGIEEMTEDSVTTTEISMQAFSGTFNPRTIRLIGWVQGRPLSVLIDSGNTHNFIQELVVTRLGFEVEVLFAFKVFIGSGEYLICKEVCWQVGITIQNMAIVEALFVLAMGGANVVLGIQWLGKLGLVTTDHKELTMEFSDGDNRVRFQGDPQLAEAEISKSGLRKLLVKGEVAYFCHLRSEDQSIAVTKP